MPDFFLDVESSFAGRAWRARLDASGEARALAITQVTGQSELMARVLGMPGYPFVIIPHPVSSAADDGLREMARIAADGVRRLLVLPNS